MNIFNFLDDVVKGAVLFVFDSLRTAATLTVHPLSGSRRLWKAARDPSRNQISSITFLFLSYLLLVGVWSSFEEPSTEAGRKVFNAAKLMATGAGADKFVPLFAGAIAGTLVVSALSRLIASLLELRGRHHERFRSAMEYYAGLLVAVLASSMGLPAGSESGLALPLATILLFGLVLVSFAAQFWFLLLRTPGLHRLIHPLWRWRHGIRPRGAMLRDAVDYVRANRRRLFGGRSLARFLWVFPLMLASWFALVPVFFIFGGGFLVAGLVSDWVSAQNESKASLVALSCNLDPKSPSASALLWNNSDGPVLEWASQIRLELRVTSIGATDEKIGLSWQPRVVGGIQRETLLPGDFVELTGPLSLSPAAVERAKKAFEVQCGNAQGYAVVDGPIASRNVIVGKSDQGRKASETQ